MNFFFNNFDTRQTRSGVRATARSKKCLHVCGGNTRHISTGKRKNNKKKKITLDRSIFGTDYTSLTIKGVRARGNTSFGRCVELLITDFFFFFFNCDEETHVTEYNLFGRTFKVTLE